jgi:glutaminase
MSDDDPTSEVRPAPGSYLGARIDGVASLMADADVEPLSADPHVSTGTLPPPDRIVDAMQRALDAVRRDRRGATSTVYPALEAADPELVAIALAGVSGRVESVGDDHARFTIMSVAKPFVLALVADAIGAERVRSIVGVNATGLAFNAAEPIERMPGGRTNPMVNAGAIATTALTPGRNLDDRWAFLLDGLSRLAGRSVGLDDDVLASAQATNHRNRALANLLYTTGAIVGDPAEAVELYTRQSCLALDVRDVATMGATIANGGKNPHTGDHVVDATVCHDVMAAMATAGLYETSGDWLWDVGLPGKSGISGAVVALSPGKGAIAAFSPRLDDAGNSIRGQIAAQLLSQELGLDVFAARAE